MGVAARMRVVLVVSVLAALGASRSAAAEELAGQPTARPAYMEPRESPPRVLDTPSTAPLRLPARLQPPITLAEPSGSSGVTQAVHSEPQPLSAPAKQPGGASEKPNMPLWASGAGSLALVLGVFLLVVWVVRRAMPGGSAQLPREALEVLGRAPLVARNNAYLVRCGSKLLLLNVSATTVETLTEITDPDEVDRLRAICQRGYGGAASTFRQALAGYSRHGEAPYVGNHDDQFDFGHMDEMDRRQGARL
jgi:flagellar biogenesis protein FliO